MSCPDVRVDRAARNGHFRLESPSQPRGEERLVTFQCEICGTIGRAPAPGAAQCRTCGQVAIAGDGEAIPPAGASRGAASVTGEARLVPRLATLWVRPGADEGPTPEPAAIPTRRRPLRRAAAALATIASGAALALGAAVALRGGWPGADRAASAPAPAAPHGPTTSQDAPPRTHAPTPVAHPEPLRAGPIAPAPSRRLVRAPTPTPPAVASPVGIAGRPDALQDPSPVDRRCVPRTLRARPDLSGRLPPELAVRFQVGPSGAVGGVEVLGDVRDRDLVEAVEEAVRGCAFHPGLDEAGRPTSLPVVMRIRFGTY
jgi:TonB family protein